MKDRTFNILSVSGVICIILFAVLPFLAFGLSFLGVPDSILMYLIFAAFGCYGLGFVMAMFVAADAGKALGQGLACLVALKALRKEP